jgi:hydroxymethylglutaryl-CoA reductase (NADPH)
MRRLSASLPPHSRSSGLWLAATALVSSSVGFMFALLGAWYIGMTIDPVLLGEALPFLVITVGFEKPFVLTRAVFMNPACGPDGGSKGISSGTTSRAGGAISPTMSRNGRRTGNGGIASYDNSPMKSVNYPAFSRSMGISPTSYLGRFAPPVPARKIVLSAVSSTGIPIIRDYAIEIAVLIAGAMSGVEGLKEFCGLAALILICDCIMLFGFFTAVLTIMVEVSLFSMNCFSK